jgi:hypothetical protein
MFLTRKLFEKVIFHSKSEQETKDLAVLISKFARNGDSFLLDGYLVFCVDIK